ncbi:MAG TPA: serine/threonine-protein kinase, partial [Anaeromyxobacter sp.]
MTGEAARTRMTVRPGALTALLGELARAPDATGWSVPAQLGERIGRFEIVREIGRGGFGVVYAARDTELGRSVAFKAIRAGCCDEVREQRALAEAEAAARLAHPNIVHLYDVGRCERGPFLIMELLRGESLDERLARGPFKLRDAVHVAVEVARGLAHAHEQGVVHRDLKPGNVFLCDDGQVKVLDFGLAHVFDRRGADGGTPEYMSPEQARGEPGDTRSDVYALGVTVRELLPDPPPAIAKLLVRMTAGDPDARPRDGAEAHAALARIQRALEPRRLWWAGWGLAAVTLAAAGAIALRARPPPPGRLLTAMADAENATGDPELDGVAELLRAGLDGSRRVSIMARSRLVNLLRQAGGSLPPAIGEPQARTAAREARAQLLILPAVRRAGGGYEVVVRAVDLSRDEPFVVAVETAGAKANVPTALDRLARRLRKALREEAQDAPRGAAGVAELAPANPEALRLFARGKRLHSEGRFDEALDAFEKASAADPSFLLPRVEILDYARGWVPSRAFYLDERAVKEHVDALRANVHRLPDREQAWLETYLLLSDQRIGNATEELALYDRAIEAWPEDPRPYVAAARKLLMHRADADAARPYLDRAVALAPLDEGWAVDFLLALGRPDDALARTRRWAEEQPGRLAFTNLAFVHRVRGEVQESLAAARRALEFPRVGPVGLLRPFAVGDALDEAEAVYAGHGGPPPAWLAMRGR